MSWRSVIGGVLCVAAAGVVGLVPAAGTAATPNKSFGYNVPFLSQKANGTWDKSMNCGPTCCIMADGFLRGTPVNNARIDEANVWLKKNVDAGFAVPNGHPRGASAADMTALMTRSYGLRVEKKYGKSVDDVINDVAGGKLAIVGCHMKQVGGLPTLVGSGGVGHWVLVVGWDGKVIVHDPGTDWPDKGKFRAYTVAAFDASWATQGRVYLLVSKK